MNDRDRLLSFVTDALDSLDHYIKYPGRNVMDLVVLEREVDKLHRDLHFRLGGEFSEELYEAYRQVDRDN